MTIHNRMIIRSDFYGILSKRMIPSHPALIVGPFAKDLNAPIDQIGYADENDD
ncbi:MAG: hypothetical protein JWM91_2048 [Rhodospirillales bacterium]|nr:hypothetical protein [Rhodospirillales bacterium]